MATPMHHDLHRSVAPELDGDVAMLCSKCSSTTSIVDHRDLAHMDITIITLISTILSAMEAITVSVSHAKSLQDAFIKGSTPADY